MATKTITTQSAVDVSEFREMAAALKKADAVAYLTLKRNLKAAGDLIAKDARQISSRYSSTIPPTIKVRARGVSIAVEAGGNFGGASDKATAKKLLTAGYGTSSSDAAYRRAEEGVVIAGLFELGNKGGGKSDKSRERGQFRHPVFATDTWVNQEMHPFLVPAGRKNEAAVAALVVEATDAMAKAMTTWVGTLGGHEL